MVKKKNSASRQHDKFSKSDKDVRIIHVDELPKEEAERHKARFKMVIEEAMRRHPDDCVGWALAGDWQLLMKYINVGGNLNVASVRQIFADLIRKKLKRPDGTLGPGWRSLEAAIRVNAVRNLMDRGLSKTRAVSRVAEAYEITEKTVWNNIKDWGLEPPGNPPVRWQAVANGDYLASYPS
jgi:hypothetical protein